MQTDERLFDQRSPGSAFLMQALDEALLRFDVPATSDPLIGPRGMSIGTRVCRAGANLWMRVAPFRADRMDKEWWTGNLDANVLTGVRRPRVVDRIEWTEEGLPLGADLMDYVPDQPLAQERMLLEPFDASDSWWTDLRGSIDRLAEQPSGRNLTPMCRSYGRALETNFGDRVDPRVPQWRTEHADLQWSNVTAPRLWILDWELWGPAMAGLGPASLYCTALGVPAIAERVYDTFADILDSAAGRYAQLCVISDLTDYRYKGDAPEVHLALRRLADTLLAHR